MLNFYVTDGAVLTQAEGKGRRAKGNGQRATGNGQRARGKGQKISKKTIFFLEG